MAFRRLSRGVLKFVVWRSEGLIMVVLQSLKVERYRYSKHRLSHLKNFQIGGLWRMWDNGTKHHRQKNSRTWFACIRKQNKISVWTVTNWHLVYTLLTRLLRLKSTHTHTLTHIRFEVKGEVYFSVLFVHVILVIFEFISSFWDRAFSIAAPSLWSTFPKKHDYNATVNLVVNF